MPTNGAYIREFALRKILETVKQIAAKTVDQRISPEEITLEEAFNFMMYMASLREPESEMPEFKDIFPDARNRNIKVSDYPRLQTETIYKGMQVNVIMSFDSEDFTLRFGMFDKSNTVPIKDVNMGLLSAGLPVTSI
ncbi:MAG: hypothetical protein UT34_C0001G0001 [candidate division WS6 bacterium GW2011_GWF2_39_15]|uniref:Uncharacterized protein n=1 Tax=candidate division WS6 bacterium GW2011_GWF2_39_15 TaxID=1619100 RepID=A0A0G0MZC9_9BACT|nr:MAG: hypothetical protein UT34_C0001G0001 [candidate division WS6 bacterium GW2011_GWF2_39_15]